MIVLNLWLTLGLTQYGYNFGGFAIIEEDCRVHQKLGVELELRKMIQNTCP